MALAQNPKLGALFGFISALSFALTGVFVKKIGTDLPVSLLIFARFTISLILLMPWLATAKDFSFRIQEPVRYFFRIFSALLALYCLFYAIKFIPLVDALLLNNTAPLFVPIVAWLIVGAKTPRKAIAGILVGFIGILIILPPTHEIFSLPAIFGLLSGFFAAIAIVQMRLISKTSSLLQMLFYYFSVSTLISGIAATLEWQTPQGMDIWLMLLAIGIFGTLYQVFATLSYSIAPVRLMSTLTFLSVIFGGFFDWLIWDNTPSALTIIGALCVIIGAIITVYFGHKEISLQKNKN